MTHNPYPSSLPEASSHDIYDASPYENDDDEDDGDDDDDGYECLCCGNTCTVESEYQRKVRVWCDSCDELTWHERIE